jgi:hypothetical protein
MLMRINWKNYLVHMIDYFTRDELLNMYIYVISTGLRVRQSVSRCGFINQLYPTSETISEYANHGDLNLFNKTYLSEIKHGQSKHYLYRSVIEAILYHNHNIILMGLEYDDYIIDVIVHYLKSHFNLPCVDLNELFTKGETDLFYIDHSEVKSKSRELKKTTEGLWTASVSATASGRLDLIETKMKKKEMITKLKELGVKLKPEDMDIKVLRQLLKEIWLGEIE